MLAKSHFQLQLSTKHYKCKNSFRLSKSEREKEHLLKKNKIVKILID